MCVKGLVVTVIPSKEFLNEKEQKEKIKIIPSWKVLLQCGHTRTNMTAQEITKPALRDVFGNAYYTCWSCQAGKRGTCELPPFPHKKAIDIKQEGDMPTKW